jgi:hypothetical protein
VTNRELKIVLAINCRSLTFDFQLLVLNKGC